MLIKGPYQNRYTESPGAISLIIVAAMNYFCIVIFLTISSLREAEAFRKKQQEKRANVTRKPFEVDKFLMDMLNYHNKERYIHGWSLLKLDQRLSENAAEWAEWLLKKNLGAAKSKSNKTVRVEFQHYASEDYSENIFRRILKDPNTPSDEKAAYLAMYSKDTEGDDDENKTGKGWVTFGDDLDYENPSFGNHSKYIQLIYKSTMFVGCGRFSGDDAYNENKPTLVVVCHYLPAMPNNPMRSVFRKLSRRNREDYNEKNLTAKDKDDIRKPKHVLIRYQETLRDFLVTMHYKERRRHWYDFFHIWRP